MSHPEPHTCPTCGRDDLPPYSRYPSYLCHDCAELATDEQGRSLSFGNTHFSGGFEAWYTDDGSPYPGGGRCWVKGVACIADEARFGGIVVQPASEGHPG